MKRNKKNLCRVMALLLTLLALLSCFTGCAAKGRTMMELDGTEMTVNVFRLFLP